MLFIKNMKKRFFIFTGVLSLFFLITACWSSPAPAPIPTLDKAVSVAAKAITAKLTDGKIAVISFATSSEGLSEYVVEELTIALANNGQGLVVVERQALELIRQELKFQLSGEVNDESAQSIGKLLGAQYIATGSLTNVGDTYRFRVKVLTVETAAVVATSSTDVSKQDKRVAFFLKDTSASSPKNNSINEFVFINGGSFTMGSPSGESGRDVDEGPQHHVTVDSFYMSRYEVTQKEWVAVMGRGNGSYFSGDDLPVEQVSWNYALLYCNKRSVQEGLTPAYTIYEGDWSNGYRWTVTWNRSANGYRLPTEAEWEYACRAGTTTPFNTGNNITTAQANYGKDGYYEDGTMPVGSFAPNQWGLYDMHGNVREWCWDLYGSYSNGSQFDPTGAGSGYARVIRGGSWYNYVKNIRSTRRDKDSQSSWSAITGFRLARTRLEK